MLLILIINKKIFSVIFISHKKFLLNLKSQTKFMKQKLYLNINIIQKGTMKQSRQLIRVDDIKEFLPLLFGSQTSDHFRMQNLLIAKGQLEKPQELHIRVIPDIFEILISKVNQKIGSIYKMNTNSLEIVQGSNFNPCIVIEKDIPREVLV